MFTFGHDGASTPCKGLRQRLFEVENWFEQLAMAAKTKGHLKAVMHRLFECAMKWALFPLGRNPMELVEIKDVTKRQKPPRVLTHDEFWNLVKFLQEPYRTMVLVAQCLGLRISEGMALQWSDFDFANLTVRVQRGVVHESWHAKTVLAGKRLQEIHQARCRESRTR